MIRDGQQAVRVSAGGTNVTIEDSALVANDSPTGGGAIVSYADTLTVNDTIVSGDNATAGGAIFVRRSEVTISDLTIDGNKANQNVAQYSSITLPERS